MEGPLVDHLTRELAGMNFERREVRVGDPGVIHLFGKRIGNPGAMVRSAEDSLEAFLEARGFESVTAAEVVEKTGMSDMLLPMAPNSTDRVALFEGPRFYVFVLLRTRTGDQETELSIKLEECPLDGYPEHS